MRVLFDVALSVAAVVAVSAVGALVSFRANCFRDAARDAAFNERLRAWEEEGGE